MKQTSSLVNFVDASIMLDQNIISHMTGNDPFQSDITRQSLAAMRNSEQLAATYKDGVLPDLPDLSSEALWNQMANYNNIPDFRLRRLRQVSKLLPQSGRVLDIGSGWGEIIPMVLGSPSREYVAMDFSDAMLKKLADQYPGIRCIHGGIETLSEKFDVIMALEVCEHIQASKIMDFYADVRRNLAKDGKFLVTVPLYEDLKSLTLQCPNCHQMHNRMGHVRSYTPELIVEELKLGGFEVEKISYTYIHFTDSVIGKIRRVLINEGRKLVGMGEFRPLNAVISARAAAR